VDYEHLVDTLLRAKFKWVLCGYPHAVLHRLGKPIWTRDMQLLGVRMKQVQEDRSECLWSNFSPEVDIQMSLCCPGRGPNVRMQCAAYLPLASRQSGQVIL